MWTGKVTPQLRILTAPVEYPVSVPNTLIALTALKTPVTGDHTPSPDLLGTYHAFMWNTYTQKVRIYESFKKITSYQKNSIFFFSNLLL